MENIRVVTNYDNYKNDFMEMVRAFNPDNDENAEDCYEFAINLEEKGKNIEIIIKTDLIYNNLSPKLSNLSLLSYDSEWENCTVNSRQGRQIKIIMPLSDDMVRDYAKAKRYVKIKIYEVISECFNMTLPYGSLTGIRPTKLFRESGEDVSYFSDVLHVSPEKTALIKSIVDMQRKYYVVDERTVDVFINIPFCTTRCSYCSFISAEIGRVRKLIPDYVECLIREIRDVKRIVKDNNYTVRAIYIGGGTPTSLDDADFKRILEECRFDAAEFTVEAGRPDTITPYKLAVMRDNGVGRISVNPQSFNERTLALIGRNHSVDDIYRVYDEALKYGFTVNMDLIAMLPGEGMDDFCRSVDKAIELRPHNITVHTLALKKGSKLKESNYDNKSADDAFRMVDYSREALTDAGYAPYYMYRQKYMSGNLENAGYCRDETPCLYNIDIMEESLSIIASGAGGISKRLFGENRLERFADPKGIEVYLARINDIINNKYSFFK